MNYVEDIEVVRRRLEQRFTAGVPFGDRFEVLVLDTSLLDQCSVVVTDGYLGRPFVKVYT